MSASDTAEAVESFLQSLVHPMKVEIEAIRRCVLDADPAISEGVKWNAPSFRTHEYFATTNLREKQGIGVILHLGAEVRDLGPGDIKIADPSSLLKWLAADRASVTFRDLQDFEAKRVAFTEVVRAWAKHV
jgi:hypothetical protein